MLGGPTLINYCCLKNELYSSENIIFVAINTKKPPKIQTHNSMTNYFFPKIWVDKFWVEFSSMIVLKFVDGAAQQSSPDYIIINDCVAFIDNIAILRDEKLHHIILRMFQRFR